MYNSPPPQLVKRGIVKCFYESAKRLATQPPPPHYVQGEETSVIYSCF